MRNTFLAIVLSALAFLGAAYLSYRYLDNAVPSLLAPSAQRESSAALATTTKTIAAKSGVTNVASAKAVIAPGPLRVTVVAPQVARETLTVRGIILDTNTARAQNGGLPPLAENTILDRDAQLKLEDMFNRQYFEHVSPTGVGPSDLADKVGYAYVLVGENLALGGFISDQDLLTAWMNSPGHRANILNSHYQEIGVAVGKGMYQGELTWLAVQSFGMPRSACPSVNESLKTQIEANNAVITTMRARMDAKKAQIDATSQNDPNYNIYVGEFNALVPPYNNMVETSRILVANYNSDVNAFNTCINTAVGHTVVAQ